jgi:hypothetical protein
VDRGGRGGAGRISDKAVARAVRAAAARAGIDPATVSGHSLRGGFATSAARAGALERTIGHRSEAMVRRYIDEGNLFEESASQYLNPLSGMTDRAPMPRIMSGCRRHARSRRPPLERSSTHTSGSDQA